MDASDAHALRSLDADGAFGDALAVDEQLERRTHAHPPRKGLDAGHAGPGIADRPGVELRNAVAGNRRHTHQKYEKTKKFHKFYRVRIR